MQVAKVWFDSVQASKEQAYITLYDTAAIKEYYKAAQDLCEAQTAFMKSTWEMESKIDNKKSFWTL